MINEDVRNIQFSSSGEERQLALKFKKLLILPLLMLPFITLAFWALDGGKGTKHDDAVGEKEGLNLNLPSANLKEDGNEDKLTFYEKAQQQEEKTKDALQNDSLFKLHDSFSDPNRLDDIVASSPSRYDPTPKDPFTGLNTSPVHSEKYKDVTEEQIMDRLRQLQQQVNKPQMSSSNREEPLASNDGSPVLGSDVDRLEDMMKMLQDKKADDPEMQKLEGMLDKIIDIQHPDRVKERLKEKSIQQKANAFPVYLDQRNSGASLLTADTNRKRKVVRYGFYGLNDQIEHAQNQNAVEAVVHETQTLVNGSSVKLRLINDIYLGGALIPKGEFLFGVASLEGERLKIEIHSIRYNNSIFPVQLGVYDLDGMPGINIPGGITRDVAKRSADNSMQNLEWASLNPSLAAQATTAGINAAKSLLSRKVKLVKVTVKAGYQVLLWNKEDGQ